MTTELEDPTPSRLVDAFRSYLEAPEDEARDRLFRACVAPLRLVDRPEAADLEQLVKGVLAGERGRDEDLDHVLGEVAWLDRRLRPSSNVRATWRGDDGDDGKIEQDPDGFDGFDGFDEHDATDHPVNDTRPAWPVLADAAYHGLAGHVVRALAPHTEADPAAMLATFLAGWGNALGSGPHAIVGAEKHPARLDVLIVGDTSLARKGTSLTETKSVLALADPNWAQTRIMGGLSSGEGLIARVADPVPGPDGKPVSVGETDKRLWLTESEFARVLAVKGREGSTLSAILRQAWDHGDLRVLTKQAQTATGAHVSIVGHITVEELKRHLTDTDAANGFANRHLFVAARRAQLLPDGGNLPDEARAELGRKVARSLAIARPLGTLQRTAAAGKLWHRIYTDNAADHPPGLVGALSARADAQTLRLSVIYACLDGSTHIDVPHLEAATAMWKYCRDTLEHVFGEHIGDATADRLEQALLAAGPNGLDRTQQSAVFGRNIKAKDLERARHLLIGYQRAAEHNEGTGPGTRRVLVHTQHTD